jgi:hypothetical protein
VALAYTDVSRIRNQPQRFGQLNARIVDVRFDSSYPTGGEEVTESALGFNRVLGAVLLGASDGAGDGTVTSIILNVETEATPKIVCYDGGAEVTNATDLSGISLRIMFFGV